MHYENSFTLRKMVAAWGKPLQFRGRSTRTELIGYFIMFGVFGAAISWVGIGLGLSVSFDEPRFPTFDLANFLLWLPFPALAVRRFHDQNRSGWWALPLILSTTLSWLSAESLLGQPTRITLGLIYAIVFVLLFWKPSNDENNFGRDPRLDAEDSALAAD
jgi:uncharacterized membrane protein YhaH (DUF805 family)